jgi:5-deoxy-glucuronate isomerase
VTQSAVPASALPNSLTADQLRLAPGEPVTPARAGWRYLSFALRTLDGPIEVGAAEQESALVVFSGGVRVRADGAPPLELPGRASVWDGMPWAAYLPPGCRAAAAPLADSATIAVVSAPASGRQGVARSPLVIGPEDVEVEVRGAGNATRQVNHIITPDFPADRLEVVEVYTPSGNWSSWPPHKHDVDDMPREAVLEEVYCYQFRRPEAWGIQRVYRGDGSRDALWAVRGGEVVLITDGYHPFVATHADDAYYLNALAGDRRTMACSFDPNLDFVRAAWSSMAPDPRVPLVRG